MDKVAPRCHIRFTLLRPSEAGLMAAARDGSLQAVLQEAKNVLISTAGAPPVEQLAIKTQFILCCAGIVLEKEV